MTSVTTRATACIPACVPADLPSPASIVRSALIVASSSVPFLGARSGKIWYRLKTKMEQECIPVGCVPPACCPYLPACTAPGGGCTCPGVYLPVGCTCLGGVPTQGGVPAQEECTCPEGVYLPGGCTCPGEYLPRGVYLPRGWYLPGRCTCQGCTRPGGCTCPGTPPCEQNGWPTDVKHNLHKLHLQAVISDKSLVNFCFRRLCEKQNRREERQTNREAKKKRREEKKVTTDKIIFTWVQSCPRWQERRRLRRWSRREHPASRAGCSPHTYRGSSTWTPWTAKNNDE